MKRALALGRRLPLHHLVPVLLALLLLPVLWQRVSVVDPNLIVATLGDISLGQWALALVATGFSFLAVGHYDAVLHRALGTGIAPARARWAGMRAIALSQTLGLSALTGALVRWRALPELDILQATRLSVFVGGSFLGAWAVVAMIAVALGGGQVSLPDWVPALAAAAILAALLVIRYRDHLPRGWVPPLTSADGLELVGWTLFDTGCAAFALWVFLPADLQVTPMGFFTAYLIALGAGLVANTPGGIGAFELTLLGLLPALPEAPLLASVLGFRIVYYLVPASIALITLWRIAPAPVAPRLRRASDTEVETALATLSRPDWGLVRQSGMLILSRSQTAGWMCAKLGRLLVSIGPSQGATGIADLAAFAVARGLTPIAYKVSARTAAQARERGWATLRTGAEAVIAPETWHLDDPSRRQLRRKLRHSINAGVTVARHQGAICPEFAEIAQDWSRANRGERGFSMGRFDRDNRCHQRIYLARDTAGRAIAFVTFRVSGEAWLLDLMRHRTHIPDGTMHQLIVLAIEDAKSRGVRQVSLAAVPDFARILSRLNRRGAGLAQFKQCFSPRWQPLYATAAHPVVLWLGLARIAFAIHRPPPVSQGLTGTPGDLGPDTVSV